VLQTDLDFLLCARRFHTVVYIQCLSCCIILFYTYVFVDSALYELWLWNCAHTCVFIKHSK